MKTLTELVQDAQAAIQAVADNVPAVEIVSESVVPLVTIGAVSASEAQKNTEAIRRTLARKGRCDYPPGLTRIDNDARVASGNQIRGLGNPDNPSIIQVVSGSPAVRARGPSKSWYSIFQSNTANGPLVGDTFGLPVGPAHGVTISNLVLDCGFDEQVKTTSNGVLVMSTTTQAISIEGLGLAVEDVEIRNAAKGLGGGECFPIRMFAPAVKCPEARAARLSRIRCSHVGSAGSTHQGVGGDEITLFSLVGSPANMLVAPVIEDCVVTGLKRGPSQPSPISAFHMAYHVGGQIRHNTVLDSDATCVYVDTGRSRFARVTGNAFGNVLRGVFFNAMTDFFAEDFSVDGNRIEIYRDKPAWAVNTTPAAILLQAGSIISPFARGQFAGNVIRGMEGDFGGQHFYSRGIYLELRNKTDATGLVASDNLIDVLQPPTGQYYNFATNGGQARLALYVSNQSAWDSGAPCLRTWGNRDSSGVLLPITVTDSAYLPRLSVPSL